jgi:hypothetical protein
MVLGIALGVGSRCILSWRLVACAGHIGASLLCLKNPLIVVQLHFGYCQSTGIQKRLFRVIWQTFSGAKGADH